VRKRPTGCLSASGFRRDLPQRLLKRRRRLAAA